jgi:hypothetical protein
LVDDGDDELPDVDALARAADAVRVLGELKDQVADAEGCPAVATGLRRIAVGENDALTALRILRTRLTDAQRTEVETTYGRHLDELAAPVNAALAPCRGVPAVDAALRGLDLASAGIVLDR